MTHYGLSSLFNEIGETGVRKAPPERVECGRGEDDIANQAKPD